MTFCAAIADTYKPHNACFTEVVDAFDYALRKLGVHDIHGRTIWFGANDRQTRQPIKPEDIVYNTEQIAVIGDHRPLIVPGENVIWDYAQANIDLLNAAKRSAILCPIGYAPSMEVIPTGAIEDVDVLFYGWINERRAHILRDLEAAGLRVLALPLGTYGAMRDRWISKSKVVLNMHFHEGGIFEVFRVSHLLANRRCVVTETPGADRALDALATAACATATYDNLVHRCRELVDNAPLRREIAERGYEHFRKLDLVENVRKAIEAV